MTKLRTSIASCICVCATLISTATCAELIGSHSVRAEIICDNSMPVTSLDLSVYFGEAVPDSGGPAYFPFDFRKTITAANVGDQYLVSDEANLSSAISLLTNNSSELVGDIVWCPGGDARSVGYQESETLTGPGFNGTDFFGSGLADMRLTIDGYGQRDVSTNEVATYIDYTVDYFDGPVPQPPVVDDSADVADDAEIGDGSTVGANTVIAKGVSVGEGSNIGADVTIKKEAQLGDNTVVGDGSTINKDVTAGKDLTVGSNVTIHKDVMIGVRVTIGDNTVIHKGTIIGNDVWIGVGVFIGNNVTIPSNRTIGDGDVIPNDTVIP